MRVICRTSSKVKASNDSFGKDEIRLFAVSIGDTDVSTQLKRKYVD